ncbi:MAG TPA: hypothetical protein VGG25_16755 [Streptosporangiaceae bacterium]|jgi:hypothetical protein
MSCHTLTDPVCHAAHSVLTSVAGSFTGDILGALARAFTSGIRWTVQNTAAWWIQVPSPGLSGDPAVARIQQWLLPVTGAVAVGGVIAAGLRMAITRKGSPLLDVTGGLLTLAAVTALGAAVATLLLRAGDAWSSWVLRVSTGGHFTQRLTEVLDLGGKAAPAVVIIFGSIAIIFALVQAVLMLFRQAALVLLAGVLPLAAAGAVAPVTRTWVRKVTAWMLALICYKPAAAAVYATAFTMIGSGHGPRTALMGFVMLALSVLALPALMRFFTWTTGAIAGGGGGGQFLGGAAMGAVALGAMRSAPGGAASAAQDQAAYLSSRLGPPASGPGGTGSGGGGPGGSPPPAPPPGSGPSWPGAGSAPGGVPMGAATGARPAAGTDYSSGTGSTPAGAARPAGAAATGAAGSAPAGAADGGAAAGASAAGPAAAAATAAAESAARAARQASGAMEPGDRA